MKRLHTTEEKEIRLNHKYGQIGSSRDYFKPVGLWYSLDDAWFEWCSNENFGGVYENTFELELDHTNILVICNRFQLRMFYDQYKYEMYPGSFGIDWAKVKANYKGIEIQDYHSMRWDVLPFSGNTWFGAWDCDSGCVWDLSAIKSVKESQSKFYEIP